MVRCGSSKLALSRRLVDLPLRLLEKDVIVLLEMQVRSEEERQSGSSSGCAGRLRVHRTACSSDLSCRKSRWPSLGRLLCTRFMSIEHDAFFSFYRPQMGARIKNGFGGPLPTTATGLAYFWAWDQKPRTARCRMRDRRAATGTPGAVLAALVDGRACTEAAPYRIAVPNQASAALRMLLGANWTVAASAQGTRMLD